MSDPSLDRLRRAFASLDARSDEPGPSPSPEAVWRAAAGELDPAATRELADRLVDDPELAREWRLALELICEQRGGAGDVVPAHPRWRRPLLAVAASALIVLGAAAVWRTTRPSAPVYRAVGAAPVVAVAGDGETLPRDAFVLRWSTVEGARRYRVSVSDAGLDLLHESDGLRSTSLRVPPDDLDRVADGAHVLWQITAVTEEGATVTSPTFVAIVR